MKNFKCELEYKELESGLKLEEMNNENGNTGRLKLLFASQGTELALEYVRSRIQFEEFQMSTRIQRTRIRFEIGGNEQRKGQKLLTLFRGRLKFLCQSGDRIRTRIRKISNPVRRISNVNSNTKNSNPV